MRQTQTPEASDAAALLQGHRMLPQPSHDRRNRALHVSRAHHHHIGSTLARFHIGGGPLAR